jgi:hypothetical protein
MTSDVRKVVIEDDLRRMALAGATDDELQSFVDARRRGDTELVDRLMSLAHVAPADPVALTPLQRLRVAALRPLVNSLDAHALYAYIGVLWPLTDQLVQDHQDPSQWANDTFVDSIARSLMRVALKHIQPGRADPLGVPNQR